MAACEFCGTDAILKPTPFYRDKAMDWVNYDLCWECRIKIQALNMTATGRVIP